MRISDWSSDVCSSDLGDLADDLVFGQRGHPQRPVGAVDQHIGRTLQHDEGGVAPLALAEQGLPRLVGHPFAGEGHQLRIGRVDLCENRYPPQDLNLQIGRASCGGRECQYVSSSVAAVTLKQQTSCKCCVTELIYRLYIHLLNL